VQAEHGVVTLQQAPDPGERMQQDDIEARFRKAANARGITALLPADGGVVPLEPLHRTRGNAAARTENVSTA
jgi:hypothetical protein